MRNDKEITIKVRTIAYHFTGTQKWITFNQSIQLISDYLFCYINRWATNYLVLGWKYLPKSFYTRFWRLVEQWFTTLLWHTRFETWLTPESSPLTYLILQISGLYLYHQRNQHMLTHFQRNRYHHPNYVGISSAIYFSP
jgi:hypothetical protein